MDERDRVVVRLVLGLAQMVGAVAGACLLFRTGISGPTLRVIGVTTLLTVVSRLLFGGGSMPPSPRG
jgi:hypothetical protein